MVELYSPERRSIGRFLRRWWGIGAATPRQEALRGYLMMSPALIVLTVGVLVPFVILVVISFWTREGFDLIKTFTTLNYERTWNEPIFGTLMLRSFWISGLVTIATVVLCYPMAYFVAFHVKRNKMMWIILMSLPFWTSYLLRVFAWKVILGYEGAINSGLLSLGLIQEPLEFLLYSRSAVVITLAHSWAPFAILPMYVSLEKIDRNLLEAATDLGDGPLRRFCRITLPLSMPGVVAAAFLIFIPTTGDYVTPMLLGGPDSTMIATLVQLQFGAINNWPMGATLSIVLTFWIAGLALVFWVLARHFQRRTA